MALHLGGSAAQAMFHGATPVTRAYLGATEVFSASGGATLRTRSLTIDNTGGAAKTDYPVKVELSSANFTFASAAADGSDIRFTADDGVTPLAHWRESYDSAAETGVLWVKVPSIAAGGSATVQMHYGDAAADASDGDAVFPDLFEDFESPLATTYANSLEIGNVERYANPIFDVAAGTWKEQQWERGKAVYDAAESDPARRWKLYTSARASDNTPSIGVLFSADGETWTEYASNPIIANHEDAYVVLVDGTYHLYAEDSYASDAEINHFTSTDGITFTADAANPVIAHGGAGAWDEQKCGTPVVWKEGATWYMVYDGRPASGTQEAGLATSTDGSSWTKSANNPIVGLAFDIVPSEVVKVGSTYFMNVKDAGSAVQVWSTTDTPDTWDNTSFSDTGHRHYTADTVFVDPELTRVSMEQKTAGLWMGDVVGSDEWAAERFATATTTMDPRYSLIEAHGGELKLSPHTTGGFSLLLRTLALAVTSNFAVGFRVRKENRVSDQLYARVAIGSGTIAAAGGLDYWATYPNGYGVLLGRAASTNTRLWRTAAGTESTLGSSFAISDFAAFANFELRYLSTGALSLVREGAQLQSVTDTTHAATTKGLCITQGMFSSNGAVSYWDWFYVRPYDGLDPTVTVGAEA